MLTMLLAACGQGQQQPPSAATAHEDSHAKELLQGIWVNEDDDSPIFRIQGDSLFFADNMGEPLRFAVVNDTLTMYGGSTVRYPVSRLTDHLLVFTNQAGETIRVVKTDEQAYLTFFQQRPGPPLNQQQTIKNDTVVVTQDKRYHCYLQVNPTTYKVYKTFYNDEGMEMENIYYDNTIHLAIFHGAQKLYSHEFAKADFAGHLSDDMLRQTILNDIALDSVTADEISYYAHLAVPDTPTSYILRIVITLSPTAKMTIVSDK